MSTKNRGFTLIETVVALGILMAALAGALTLIFAVVNMAMNARNTTTANALAQKRLSDTVALQCVGCGLTPSYVATLGTKTSVNLDDNGKPDPLGHSADAYTPNTPVSENGVNYSPILYIDQNFTDIPELISGTAKITRADFTKVISYVSWSYKGQNYSTSAVQYVRNERW